MKSWPKVKWGKAGSRFKHFSKSPVYHIGSHVWPLSATSQTKSWLNMKSIFSIAYLHLPLFTYSWPYLDLITLIWSYLPLIVLILPYVPYPLNIHVCVAFEGCIYVGVHSRRDCTCQWILCYLSGLVVLETVKDRSIFRRKVADHVHWCAELSADKDVGHVGKCPRSGTLGAVWPPCRDHDVREHGV